MRRARWTPGISVKDLHLFPAYGGCYAFYRRGKLVYIGSSMNIRARLSVHRTKGALRLVDTIRMRVDQCYADHRTVEYRLIRRLKPRRNRHNVGGA